MILEALYPRQAHSHPVLIAQGCIDRLGSWVAENLKPSKVLLLVDQNVSEHYGEMLVKTLHQAGLETISKTVASGEVAKSWSTATTLLTYSLEQGLDRHSVIVAAGGGVTGDLAAFVASLHHRGIALVQVPTTLLAMVDSSIGGKTGVNFGASGKNTVGSFYQPRAVFQDQDFLTTLPDSQWRNGLAEAFKYTLIAEDGGLFWNWLGAHQAALLSRDPVTVQALLVHCVSTKLAFTMADEFEAGGRRALLNLGHSFGHALEKLLCFEIAHGQAVSWGISVAASLSASIGLIGGDLRDEIQSRAAALCPWPIASIAKISALEIRAAMSGDKKNRGKSLRLVLPTEPLSKSILVQDPDELLLLAAIQTGLGLES